MDRKGSTQYFVHVKVDEKAVNQGRCFYNSQIDTYFMKARKTCPLDQLPKELINIELEKPDSPTGHTHVEFFITGRRSILM